MAKQRLYERVLRLVMRQKMFGERDIVLVALSGGPDSVALVALLQEIEQRRWPELKIHLAHLNHQLRGFESERDEMFVRELADRLGLGLSVERAPVAELAAEAGENLEATARRVRYQFLERAAEGAGARCIATGHNMNDQAETLLMRLLRGTGTAGLSGIHPVIEPPGLINIRVVRPLLCLKRDEIESYLEEHGLSACLDSSNLVTDLTRNRIRHEILPRMLEINPRAVEAIARAAELLREEFVYALKQPAKSRELTEAGGENLNKGTVKLSVESLRGCLPAERRLYIREAIGRSRGDLRRITAAHIEAVEGLLEREKSGKKIQLPGGYEAAREFGELIIRQAGTEETGEKQVEFLELPLGGDCRTGLFRLSYNPVDSARAAGLDRGSRVALLDLDLTGERLLVRTRRPGDKYLQTGHKRIEKLKNLMIENRIPLSQRRFWPVIVNESGEIVWSPGLPVAERFSARPTTERFAIIKAE